MSSFGGAEGFLTGKWPRRENLRDVPTGGMQAAPDGAAWRGRG
jgi:hypothetical protein